MAISSQQARVVQIRSQVQYFSVHIIYTLPIISTSSIIILGMLQIYVQTRQYRDIWVLKPVVEFLVIDDFFEILVLHGAMVNI